MSSRRCWPPCQLLTQYTAYLYYYYCRGHLDTLGLREWLWQLSDAWRLANATEAPLVDAVDAMWTPDAARRAVDADFWPSGRQNGTLSGRPVVRRLRPGKFE